MTRLLRVLLSVRAAAIALALAVGCGTALGAGASTAPASTAPASTAPASGSWTGGIDLYRPGTFSTQRSWLWCTAANVQIIRNIMDREIDHSRAAQQRYFDWMRVHNRYSIPVSDGVDPVGWTAGLRHFVDTRYRLATGTSFVAALRAAVTSLRRTGLPVGLLVAHGTHAWVLTGFTATADPAVTSAFVVTSVRVVGPLYGLQSRGGYDMKPDTKLTPGALRRFWTPWRYAPVRMAWEGKLVWIEGAVSIAATIHIPAPSVAV